jgi:predicted dehydrogenase
MLLSFRTMNPRPTAQRLRAAVIGAGKISQEHLRFLRGSDLAVLAAVCDRSPALGKLAAATFGAPQAFTEHERMLEAVRPDVVHVLAPAHTHRTLVADCLQAGAHVIVEKPVAPSHRELQELWALATAHGRQLIEDHNYRFNEPVLACEQLVKSGALGEVREIDVRLALNIRNPGGRYGDANLPHPSHQLPAGVVHEFISHLAYLTLLFLPSFERVAAAWSNHGGGELFKHDDLDALVIGGACHARLRFAAGTWPECFTLVLRGTKGTVETDLFQPYLLKRVPRGVGAQLTPTANHLLGGLSLVKAGLVGLKDKILQKTPYEGLHRFLGLTYEALVRQTPPPVTRDDMDRTSRLIEALLSEDHRL